MTAEAKLITLLTDCAIKNDTQPITSRKEEKLCKFYTFKVASMVFITALARRTL